MFNFKHRKDEFFQMFDKAAQNVHEAALALQDLLEHYEDVPNKVRRIKNLEHAGDEYTHQMLDRLARMFITPLDRDDIQRAASRLDDVLDEMDAAANRMMLFKIERTTEDSKGLGGVLVKITGLLIEAFGKLHDLRHPEGMQSICVEIHTQENEGDRLTQHAMANLFEQATDPRDIIKWKDVYEILEKAIDRCEDVADVLQNIMIKHT